MTENIGAARTDAAEREVEALMIAGYKALARENLELAEEGMESFWQIIKNDPEWTNAPDPGPPPQVGITLSTRSPTVKPIKVNRAPHERMSECPDRPSSRSRAKTF